MNETAVGFDETSANADVSALQVKAERLEAELRRVTETANRQLVQANLKTAALRAGMVDLDGLKLVDSSALQVNTSGDVDGAEALMARMRKDKPWLFGIQNSSSVATPPPSAPVKRKLATDMTYAEWREARQELLRRR